MEIRLYLSSLFSMWSRGFKLLMKLFYNMLFVFISVPSEVRAKRNLRADSQLAHELRKRTAWKMFTLSCARLGLAGVGFHSVIDQGCALECNEVC